MDPTPENVSRVLEAATSRDYEESKAASDQLEKFHRQKGFHSTLQTLFLADDLPFDLRLVALTQLKNGVERHWKRAANFAIPADEQALIRSRLLPDLFSNAYNVRFSPFQAIVIAKIARNDFPDTWPSLFTDLVGLLNDSTCNDVPRLTLVLNIIRNVIKEFASLRMMKPRRAFYEAVPSLMLALVDRLHDALAQFIQNPLGRQDQAIKATDYLKCVRRLAVIGFEEPHKDENVHRLWKDSLPIVGGILDFVLTKKLASAEAFGPLLAQFSKFYLSMSKAHPVSFAFLPDTVDLVRLYWLCSCQMQGLLLGPNRDLDGTTTHEKYDDDRSLITMFEHKSLSLLRSCFKLAFSPLPIIKYRATEEERQQPDQAKALVKDNLLNPDFVKELFAGVVTGFFVYDKESLNRWANDPEEWEINQSEEDDAFDVTPRPCAERLLMDMALNYKALVVPMLLDRVKDIALETIAVRETVYTALGTSAPMVGDAFDFNVFLHERLMPDLEASLSNSEGHRSVVLRYRIAILLAQWTPIGISQENKPRVYEVYQNLLQDTDLVVRITAAKRLKDICDDFGFSAEGFTPHASAIFQGVVKVMDHVETPETLLALLATMASLIERMEDRILPFADELIELLGPLWSKMEKEQQMKKAVVDILSKLVQALGAKSAPLQGVVLPMITNALEPGSPAQVYLLEDAVELLHHLVQQSEESSLGLMSLVHLLLPILEMEASLCKLALDILYSMLLLDPQALLQESVRRPLFENMAPLLDVRSNEVVTSTMAYVEGVVRKAHDLDSANGAKAIIDDLMSSGLLPKIFTSLLACWAAHQTTGPNRKDPPADARNETLYFLLLARLLVYNTDGLLSSLDALAGSQGMDAKEAIEHLLDEWYSHLDNVSMPAQKKLMVLALGKLLTPDNEIALVRLQQLMSAWTSLLLELRDPPEDAHSDSLVIKDEDKRIWGSSPHSQRQAALSWSDLVATQPLPDAVRAAMYGVVDAAGGAEAFEQRWLVNVDKDVFSEFKGLGVV